MKSSIALLSVVVLMMAVTVCQGQDTEKVKPDNDLITMPVVKQMTDSLDLLDIYFGKETEKGKLQVDLDTTLATKHMWYGFDLFDDHAVFAPSITMKLGRTGLSTKITGCYPMSSGFQDSVELDYATFYKGTFAKDTPYAINFTAKYFYYGKPNEAHRKADTQEIGINFYWPQLITVGSSSVVPSYYFASLWPSKSDSHKSGCEGFIHIFGLDYDLRAPNFWADGKEQTFSFFGNIIYNDGFGGAAVDSDWSHAVIGLRTNLESGNLTITPALYYQISMDDSVNNEDELWCGISLTYSF